MLFTNALPDRQTNQPTDTAYYRDARTHLKSDCEKQTQNEKKTKKRTDQKTENGPLQESLVRNLYEKMGESENVTMATDV